MEKNPSYKEVEDNLPRPRTIKTHLAHHMLPQQLLKSDKAKVRLNFLLLASGLLCYKILRTLRKP